MNNWDLAGPIANLPNVHDLPTEISCIRHYAMDMAYVPSPDPHETMQKFKQRIYGVLLTMVNTGNSTASCGSPANYQESHGREHGQTYASKVFPTS